VDSKTRMTLGVVVLCRDGGFEACYPDINGMLQVECLDSEVEARMIVRGKSAVIQLCEEWK